MNQNLLNTLALFAKEKSPEIRNFRICAGLVYKHREIISIGFPRKKTHPMQKKFGVNQHAIYMHAEVEALLRGKHLIDNPRSYQIYVARVKHTRPFDDSFVLGDAEPCTGCKGFIHFCGISQTVHTRSSNSSTII